MLTHISISNYTIVTSLEMEFSAGMTVITGETGAGKSIMLDALGLCLGDRADPKAVRPGCDQAQIIASFDVSEIEPALAWLRERDLLSGDECLLRRVITVEGRSRAYINGTNSTLQDCAELGALLIDIHSQHAHQSLLRKPVQRELLDAFANHIPLTRAVERTASDWLRSHRELQLLTHARDEQTARAQLLAYQVEELDALNLLDGELAALEQELKQLANAEQILKNAHQALELCEEQASATHRSLNLLAGDIHLTLVQTVPVTGVVMVTTPQEVALADARKGVAMFQKLNVPILGIVENMSYFTAPGGERIEIFGNGGGRREAERLKAPFLGEIPLFPEIREGGDRGVPVTARAETNAPGEAFTAVAKALAARFE